MPVLRSLRIINKSSFIDMKREKMKRESMNEKKKEEDKKKIIQERKKEKENIHKYFVDRANKIKDKRLQIKEKHLEENKIFKNNIRRLIESSRIVDDPIKTATTNKKAF